MSRLSFLVRRFCADARPSRLCEPYLGIYSVYISMLEQLLRDTGGARTLNPWEANIFFVPHLPYGALGRQAASALGALRRLCPLMRLGATPALAECLLIRISRLPSLPPSRFHDERWAGGEACRPRRAVRAGGVALLGQVWRRGPRLFCGPGPRGVCLRASSGPENARSRARLFSIAARACAACRLSPPACARAASSAALRQARRAPSGVPPKGDLDDALGRGPRHPGVAERAHGGGVLP